MPQLLDRVERQLVLSTGALTGVIRRDVIQEFMSGLISEVLKHLSFSTVREDFPLCELVGV